jgi:UDP-N-acetylglucosamine acyltransferase
MDGTASVGRRAYLGEGVVVGAYAVVEDDARIGDRTTVSAYAVVRGNVEIGADCFLGNRAVIGGISTDFLLFSHRDLRSLQKKSSVVIGNHTSIGDCTTVHRATEGAACTVIGSHCVFGPHVHAAHNCTVGDDTVLEGKIALGGYARVGHHCHLETKTAIHPFTTIGDGVRLLSQGRVSLDIPPYSLITGRGTLMGLNDDGLRAMGVEEENISILRECFYEFYGRSGDTRTRARAMLRGGLGTTKEIRNFLQFFLVDARRPTIAKVRVGNRAPGDP